MPRGIFGYRFETIFMSTGMTVADGNYNMLIFGYSGTSHDTENQNK
jgi:hypothetical protein